MFENLLVSFLEKYLSEYCRSTPAISFGVLSGTLQLDKLEAKKDVAVAAVHGEKRLTVSRGSLKKIVIKVAWGNLYDKPVKIDIYGFHLALKEVRPKSMNLSSANTCKLSHLTCNILQYVKSLICLP